MGGAIFETALEELISLGISDRKVNNDLRQTSCRGERGRRGVYENVAARLREMGRSELATQLLAELTPVEPSTPKKKKAHPNAASSGLPILGPPDERPYKVPRIRGTADYQGYGFSRPQGRARA